MKKRIKIFLVAKHATTLKRSHELKNFVRVDLEWKFVAFEFEFEFYVNSKMSVKRRKINSDKNRRI